MALFAGSRIPEALAQRLDAYRQEKRWSRAQVVLLSLEEYLARHAAPVPLVHDPRQTEMFPEKGPQHG